MSVDTLHYLSSLEMKLHSGICPLNTKDVKFIENIVQCFHRIWKLWKKYPKLNTELDDEMFKCIFNDMFPNFYSNNAELDVVCEFCDIEFPLLNNDLAFSYEMHKQTPEHVEIVNIFEEFDSLSLDDATPDVHGNSDENHLATCSITCNDSSLNVHSEPDSQNATTTETLRKQDAEKMTSSPPIANLLENGSTERISSIAEIYSASERRRRRYFFNKICIFTVWCNYNWFTFYRCGLCRFDAPDVTSMIIHESDRIHRVRVSGRIYYAGSKRVSFEPCVFRKGGMQTSPRCHLCNIDLPENNPNSLCHLRSHNHARRIIGHFRSSLFKNWERGIIYKDGNPYCVACQVVLPCEVAMQEHVNETAHKLKFQ